MKVSIDIEQLQDVTATLHSAAGQLEIQRNNLDLIEEVLLGSREDISRTIKQVAETLITLEATYGRNALTKAEDIPF